MSKTVVNQVSKHKRRIINGPKALNPSPAIISCSLCFHRQLLSMACPKRFLAQRSPQILQQTHMAVQSKLQLQLAGYLTSPHRLWNQLQDKRWYRGRLLMKMKHLLMKTRHSW